MIPAGQQEPWLLPSVSHTPAVAAPVAAVQRIDFPHRALLADGTFGAVLPEFQAPLRSNPQGSLRKDVHLYDIILFIARGYSKQQAQDCFRATFGAELPDSTLGEWLRREHIRWPPSNYSSEAQRSYLEAFCSSLPPAEQRVARAQLRRVQLMQRWLAGELTTQQAAEEERRIQQAAA